MRSVVLSSRMLIALLSVLTACSWTTLPERGASHSVPSSNNASDFSKNAVPKLFRAVYVHDLEARAVFRYPLINGKMTARPDSALYGFAKNSVGMAIAADGTIYAGSAPDHVLVFAAGARGHAKPIRELRVTNVRSLYVDRQGYLYVSSGTLRPTGIFIYAPNARGHDKPVQIIRSGSNAVVIDDSSGYLYSSDDNGVVSIYSSPTVDPTLVGQICGPKRAAMSVAVMTLHVLTAVYSVLNQHSFVASFPKVPDGCPSAAFGKIDAKPHLRLPTGIVVDGEELFVVDFNFPTHNQLPGAIVQLNAHHFVRQVPENVVAGPPLRIPDALALGP
jgi:hypothetical protein